MKTVLLRRLRRKANKEYYINTWSDSCFTGVCYDIMHNEPLVDYIEESIWDKDMAVKRLNSCRRQYIKNKVEELRFKQIYK